MTLRAILTLGALLVAYAYRAQRHRQARVIDWLTDHPVRWPDPADAVQGPDPVTVHDASDCRITLAPLTPDDRDWLDDTVRTTMGPAA